MNLQIATITVITVLALMPPLQSATLCNCNEQNTYHRPLTIAWKFNTINPERSRLSLLSFLFFTTIYKKNYTEETFDYLQNLINDGVNVNRPFQGETTTALDWAIENEEGDLINFLIDNNALMAKEILALDLHPQPTNIQPKTSLPASEPSEEKTPPTESLTANIPIQPPPLRTPASTEEEAESNACCCCKNS